MRIKKRIVVILIFVIFLIFFCGYLCRQVFFGEKTYRNVKVLETEGESYVTRKDVQMSVYEQMIIQGGDSLVTGEDGRVDLQLDDDKYMIVEEDSQVEFELAGNKEKGAIRIYLNQGSIYNQIDNPLSQDDSYEIHTPDGVMAVRGTQFRVSIRNVSDGTIRETIVSVFDGAVHVQLDNEADEVVIIAGEEAVINNNLSDKDENAEQTTPWFIKRGGEIEIDNLPDYLISKLLEIMNIDDDVVVTVTAMQEQEATQTPTPEPTTPVTPQPVATATPMQKPTATPIQKPMATATPTQTLTATATPTQKPTAIPTPEPEEMEIPTQESEEIEIPTQESTETPTETPSATPTETPSATPSATPTATPTATPSATPSATPTATPSETPTETPIETPSAIPTETPSQDSEPTETPSAIPTETPSQEPESTETPSAIPTETPSQDSEPTETPSETPTQTPVM